MRLRWTGFVLFLAMAAVGVRAQNGAFEPLRFLMGTWSAHATGPNGVAVQGRYTFATELNGTVLARHSTEDAACKGPVTFDCAHRDLLYVFREGGTLKAIYFDSEGHTIHYTVTTPTPEKAVFLSEESAPGPAFRLVYELHSGALAGSFGMRMPGKDDWHAYLEWSGTRADTAAGSR